MSGNIAEIKGVTYELDGVYHIAITMLNKMVNTEYYEGWACMMIVISMTTLAE